MKYWKIIPVSLMLIALLALGTGMAFADPGDDPQPPGQGPGMGWGAGQGYGQGFGQGYGRGMMGNAWWLDTVAQSLDLTVDELRSELSTGKSIADLAEERGVNVDSIIEAILAQHEAFLDDAVAAGNITEEQKDWMQANMAAMLGERVNQSWTFGGFGGWSGGRGMGRGGFGGSGRFGGNCPSGLYLGRSSSS